MNKTKATIRFDALYTGSNVGNLNQGGNQGAKGATNVTTRILVPGFL